jgi:DNA invertase Pin-like site-specific DNA recombinase
MAKKCICFTRVSSSRQDLEYQQSEVKKAALKEYKESEILEVSGKESAIKLSELERITLNEMKDLVDQYPTIESIYFFAVDRLARRVSVVMSIKEWADEHKINLVFLNPYPFSTWFRSNGIWKKNDISDIYLMFLGFGAKMEMEIKGERFRSAKALLKSQNKPTGKLLFGYTKDEDKNVRIDPNKGHIIRWIFDCYLKKEYSTTQIYDEGVELGYWNKLQARSSQSNRIRFYLSNYAYAGVDTGRDLIYPSIVTKEEVDEAKAKLDARRNLPKARTKHMYLCKSFLKDADTGYTMKADISHIRYMSMVNDDKLFTVSMNVADTIIWECAVNTKFTLLSLNDTKQIDLTKKELSEISTKITILKDYIDDINRRIEKAYTGFVNGKGRITQSIYEKTVRGLENDQKQTQEKLNSYEKREAELINYLNELLTKEKMDVSLESVRDITDEAHMRSIIEECVKTMTVKRYQKGMYHFQVNTVLPDVAGIYDYLYAPKGGFKRLYLMTGIIDDVLQAGVEKSIEEGWLLDVTDAIRIRFKMK